MGPTALPEEGISRDSPLSLYYQVKLIIKKMIESGEWGVGTKIPSEESIARRYNISRMTVRQAIKELVQEGWLYREPGIGTFVCNVKFQQGLSRLTSFTEDVEQRGMKPGAKVVSAELGAPNDTVRSVLQLKESEWVYELQRIRLADGTPLAFERIFVPYKYCSDFLSADLVGSVTKALELKGIRCLVADQAISAGKVEGSEADYLGLKKGSVVLRMKRTYYGERGIPIYYAETIYPGDKYEVFLTLQR